MIDETDEDLQYDTLPDNAGVKILPPFIYLGFLLLAIILEISMGVNLFAWGAQLAIGVLLMSFGAGIMTWCFSLFNNMGTNLPPNMPTLTLVTEGPYRISRNPIYLGMTSLYLGICIAFDLVWGVALVVPLVYIIRTYVIDREEAYLSRKFKDEYTEFCASTRRWI